MKNKILDIAIFSLGALFLIRAFYETRSVGLVFVDEAIEQNPDHEVRLSCFPYKLIAEHGIPEVLPTHEVFFIIYAEGVHTDSRAAYCN